LKTKLNFFINCWIIERLNELEFTKMDAEEAISLEELAKRCGCCFRETNNSIVKEISTEIERKFVELVQYDVSRCNIMVFLIQGSFPSACESYFESSIATAYTQKQSIKIIQFYILF